MRLGIDLGGTKIEIIALGNDGRGLSVQFKFLETRPVTLRGSLR